MLRTDAAGRWTLDAGPSTPYYKLTGELKMQKIKIFMWGKEKSDTDTAREKFINIYFFWPKHIFFIY